MKRLRGFTLNELLAVVAILSILAGIAIPMHSRTIARSKEAEGWSFLTVLRASELRYYVERDEIYTTTLTNLDIESPNNLTFYPNRLFSYFIAVAGASFTATAVPYANCANCRTLTLNQNGNRFP